MNGEHGTIVARDPFARAGLRRTCEGAGTCAWCGQERARVYRYQIEDDSGRAPVLGQPAPDRVFCNLDCFRSYSS